MYGVPDLPLSGSTRDESTEVEHTMHNVFNKTICVCYDINSSSGLLFIMCGYCYYIDPAAVRTCMQTNFTVHGQPPQFPRASAANVYIYIYIASYILRMLVAIVKHLRTNNRVTGFKQVSSKSMEYKAMYAVHFYACI